MRAVSSPSRREESADLRCGAHHLDYSDEMLHNEAYEQSGEDAE